MLASMIRYFGYCFFKIIVKLFGSKIQRNAFDSNLNLFFAEDSKMCFQYCFYTLPVKSWDTPDEFYVFSFIPMTFEIAVSH